jgi:hypothetical protein
MAPMPDSLQSTPAKRAQRAAREARLSQALRDNLRRRKQQTRARAGDCDAPAEPSDRRPGKTDSPG